MGERNGHLVGLIGAGIGESLSPALHEREAAELGLDYSYRLHDLDVSPAPIDDLLEHAQQAGYCGLNVTHPCKQQVVEHLDELSPEAAAVEAVNTVVFEDGRAIGHNTDVTGFAESFARGLPGAAVDDVVLLGAGGAGAAVVQALRAGRLTIVDVEPERAQTLADRAGAEAGDLDALADADGLVHATPTGMAGHPGVALPEERLHDGLWVAEVVYRPLDTELLQAARARGCRTLDGGGMAVFQAAGSFELFTGVAPDRERMLRHFAELVETPAHA